MKNVMQIKHKTPIQDNIFPGVRGLTSSSYIVHDYTICGHMDLNSIYVLYVQYI